MSRLLFHLTVALVTFTIGITAAYLCSIPGQPSAKVVRMEEEPLVQYSAEKERSYKAVAIACGTSDGYRASWSSVESTDGISFSISSIHYKSPKRADIETQNELKRAVEIVKREHLFDEAGRLVGKKVIATFAPYQGSSTASAKLIWTMDANLHCVRSSSLKNIPEYEKDHNFKWSPAFLRSYPS